jgi:PilZ domain-containing protein
MGKRREPRTPMELPVRIFGTDGGGKIFSENVTTIDVSQSGAKLRGVRARVKPEEIIGVTHGSNKVHFRVKWVGEPGTPKEGQVGLLNLTPEKPFWGLTLPCGALDNFRFAGQDRRQSIRVKCSISGELHPAGQPVIWGKVSDLSIGGCFVEMPIPLKVDTRFDIALWLGDIKLRVKGEVASAAPGYGIGVRFVNTSPQDRELLQRHIESIADSVCRVDRTSAPQSVESSNEQ